MLAVIRVFAVFGLRYRMSSTELILSPYFASKPPAENSMASTMSGLGKDNPSCCPERTRKGRYTSMSLT